MKSNVNVTLQMEENYPTVSTGSAGIGQTLLGE